MNAPEPRIILAGPEPLIEALEWLPASPPPDADTTLLLWIVYEDGDADWAAGWWDGEVWRDASTGGPASGEVTHYSSPMGPAL
jgi:hypothetical protein